MRDVRDENKKKTKRKEHNTLIQCTDTHTHTYTEKLSHLKSNCTQQFTNENQVNRLVFSGKSA